jgi:hypothetical protein
MQTKEITTHVLRVNDSDVQITVIRNSVMCRKLNKYSILIGHTLYVAGPWLMQKMLRDATNQIARRNWLTQTLWKLVGM